MHSSCLLFVQYMQVQLEPLLVNSLKASHLKPSTMLAVPVGQYHPHQLLMGFINVHSRRAEQSPNKGMFCAKHNLPKQSVNACMATCQAHVPLLYLFSTLHTGQLMQLNRMTMGV